ncbi:MAG: UDP-glucuronate 4-epimerase [Acidimicrobiaceae bacterium]|jgi:nucleoside-diphosphate-sugar epimerase
MRALVTGAAGFIGSTLTDSLLARDERVLAVDCFTPYYGRSDKEANLAAARRSDRFELIETDLRTCEIEPLLDGIDIVFHQSAQAGVRLSWSDGFADYAGHNILATQRLLEAVKRTGGAKVVYASSSSVYGNAATYPTTEDDLPQPHSPYGVTKLAGEHLCNLYAANWGVPTVSLRYFTVYGPRQRPDMAIHRLLAAALARESFPLYGDGSAVRDFTYVDDVVLANLAAADHDCAPGTVVNIAGGSSITMSDLLALVTDVTGEAPLIDRQGSQPGDVARTGGTVERAGALLDWKPSTDLRTGLSAQADWHRAQRA